ncbi:hypothetical protein BJV82DRAFT_709359 [Fennellomyces sp. T-0311]|nr:hypothetical protein BJV82DRAFT_709359 [Fennellomyces sp. T-0311]
MGIWTVREYVYECQQAKRALDIKKKALDDFQREERTAEEGQYIMSDRLDAYQALVQELRVLHKYFIEAGKARMSFMANTFIILSFIGFIPAAISSLDALRDQRGLGVAIFAMMCGCTVCAFAYVLWYRIVPSVVHNIILSPLFVKHRKVFGAPIQEHCCQCHSNPRRSITPAGRASRDTERTAVQTPGFLKDQDGPNMRQLETEALKSSRWIMFFLWTFPILEVFNAILYSLIIFCQFVIVVVLRIDEQAAIELAEDSSDDSYSPFRSKYMQWIFTLWILIMNILFSFCNHSPSPIPSRHHNGVIKEEKARSPW